MGNNPNARKVAGRNPSKGEGKMEQLILALPGELQRQLGAIWETRSVAKGEVLLEEGEDPGHIGYVIDGLLGMIKELPDGRRHIIGLLVPTDMYGRAFDGGMGYRIEALAESTLQVCERGKLEEILERSPEVEHMFLVNLLDELDAAREWMLVLGGLKVVQRVATFLLILGRRKQRHPGTSTESDTPINLHIAIPRADLALYLGVRSESLSRAFHELEDDGIIRINDPYDFDLLDMAALVDVAGHDLAFDDPE